MKISYSNPEMILPMQMVYFDKVTKEMDVSQIKI